MKNILICILVLFAGIVNAQTPKDYACNPHVKYSIDTAFGQCKIAYTFKDQKEVLRTFQISYNIKKTLSDIARYGVPKSYFEKDTAATKERQNEIKKGFFMQSGNFLKPDRSAIVSFYRPYCRAIAGGIISTLINERSDTRLNRIEMAMKFVQDIPYGVPEIKDSTWEVYGIYPPPEVLVKCLEIVILKQSYLQEYSPTSLKIRIYFFFFRGTTMRLWL